MYAYENDSLKPNTRSSNAVFRPTNSPKSKPNIVQLTLGY